MYTEANNLIGSWKVDLSHLPTVELYGGNATMEFKENGELIYLIEENNRIQAMLLTYEVDGDKLITDQPSMPGKETTVFTLDGDKLHLNHQGAISCFVRDYSDKK